MAVSGERRTAYGGTTAEAGGGSSALLGGNDEILGWLDVLLKGKPEQQALARTEIGMILEARGFSDDAEEAYWTNVQARSVDRRSYERLIALYQLRRDRLSESLVRRQMDEVFARPEAPTPSRPDHPARPVQSARPSQLARPTPMREPNNAPVSLARQLTSPDLPALPASPALPVLAAQPVRRLRGARRADEAPAATPAKPVDAAPQHADAPSQRAIAPAGPQAVHVTEVMPAQPLPGQTNGRRRARLLPNPGPSHRRYGARGGLIALQPTTIFAFVIASFGAAALIAFLLISWDRGSGSRLATSGAGQVPTRCADASVRFPGAHDPRGAVASAYRQQGVDVEAQRPGSARLTVDQAEQVIGGWIGASLLLEHAGQPAPKLNEWLDAESTRPSLANAILAGRHLDTMLTPDEWTEIRSWPASNCEGAFLQDPRNTVLVRLIERVVAK